jgi:hypothetical protein
VQPQGMANQPLTPVRGPWGQERWPLAVAPFPQLETPAAAGGGRRPGLPVAAISPPAVHGNELDGGFWNWAGAAGAHNGPGGWGGWQGPGFKGRQQLVEGLGGEAQAYHQSQTAAAGGHGGRADRHPQQAGALQPLLQLQGGPIATHQQRQDRPVAGGAGPTAGRQSIAPAPSQSQQFGRQLGLIDQ